MKNIVLGRFDLLPPYKAETKGTEAVLAPNTFKNCRLFTLLLVFFKSYPSKKLISNDATSLFPVRFE